MIKQHGSELFQDQGLLSAWNFQLTQASKTPLLQRLFARSSTELFDSFADSYEQLRALPRRARRALQRQLAKSNAALTLQGEFRFQRSHRSLRHKLAWSLAGAALLLALGQQVQAANITVTTKKADINTTDGLCSLSEAIINANNDAATYADCTAGSGADIIQLPRGTHNTTGTYAGPHYYGYGFYLFPVFAGLPPVTSEITIEGNGAKISRSRSAAPASIITCTASGDLTLNNLTVQGGLSYQIGGGIVNFGSLTVNNSNIKKNISGGRGGGIYNSGYTSATTKINNSSISNNTAGGGGGIANGWVFSPINGGTVNINQSQISKNRVDGYAGGGIYNGGGGSIMVTDSTISGNKAVFNFSRGGGVFNAYGGTVNIQNSLISKNQLISHVSAATGGGIHNRAILIIDNSTIEKNKANYGGGIFNKGGGAIGNVGDVTITNSTISQNQAKNHQNYFSFGGGIDNTDGTFTLTNSTVSGNKSNAYAGGINNRDNATLTVENSTITKNQAKFLGGGIYNTASSSVTLNRSLISGNKLPKSGFGPEISTYGVFTADDFNLFGFDNNSGIAGNSGSGATDVVPVVGIKTNKILSGQLKDNGGPPAANGKPNSTHALVVGSPAVDAAPCVLPTDQRDVPRPQGATCDIGAFELGL